MTDLESPKYRTLHCNRKSESLTLDSLLLLLYVLPILFLHGLLVVGHFQALSQLNLLCLMSDSIENKVIFSTFLQK